MLLLLLLVRAALACYEDQCRALGGVACQVVCQPHERDLGSAMVAMVVGTWHACKGSVGPGRSVRQQAWQGQPVQQR